ncbi:TerC/Alx family metal homeostasis membrane protein [Solwaraspora sp. WMMD1047]|uniref:TerC/Alx family metal homeostasis membrane protein n=1 Tax=Solwaraspora sp. WMMD1047 TaxID=3016102 RepID=UPI0024179FC9|nr:TerC/Alx family metal homeostasis membrane protein [Solwaraspora sp. WMMD1047]MDG4831300.1 TerC/Alx family metal homeostasis membrane protein [Solwaraspora sp. WMMD1047]
MTGMSISAAPGAVTAAEVSTVGSPTLWLVTIFGVLALLVLDFLVTRRPHEVSIREALGWSAFYIALPLAFAVFVWLRFGSGHGLDYLTGYLVEKSLSVDNLFVFMLLLAAFAVPTELAQRVLLFGITGALVLRAIFIALGAAALQTIDFAFLIFAAILIVTAVKLLRDAVTGHEKQIDVSSMRSVRLLRRFMPVVDRYHGTALTIRQDGRRALTPLALVVVAVLATDVVFAIDSVPAVFGITEDPYLVFVTNAFALLGLRALYFVLHAALSRLVHLSYGLAAILGLIGVKLALHWAHGIWPSVPEIPTLASLGAIVGILAVVTVTSLRVTRPPTDTPTGPPGPARSVAGD